jgi:membrane protein DedA with SNARE-associated domain
MPIALAFFVHYAYAILFLWVLVEQLGVPIPSLPVMLTAGTLAATHRVSFSGSAGSVLAACLLADSVWYALGRRYGNAVLRLLCRFSFEAQTCVAKTENYFHRRGAVTLLFAKFVPGLGTVAAPIAGQTGMPYPRFLLFDLGGALGWWLLLWRSGETQPAVFCLAGPVCRRHLRPDGVGAHPAPLLETAAVPDNGARATVGASDAAGDDGDGEEPRQYSAVHC